MDAVSRYRAGACSLEDLTDHLVGEARSSDADGLDALLAQTDPLPAPLRQELCWRILDATSDRLADAPADLDDAAAALVEAWSQAVYRPPGDASPSVLLELPRSTPGLADLAREAADVLPAGPAATLRAHAEPDHLRAADLLRAGAMLTEHWSLLCAALRRADRAAADDPAPARAWQREAITTSLRLADPPAPLGPPLTWGPGEMIGWAGVLGDAGLVTALVRRFAHPDAWVPPGHTGGLGVAAHAMLVTGASADPWTADALARRSLEIDHHWAGAGEQALAHWVLAHTEVTPDGRMRHVAELLDLRVDEVRDDPGAVVAAERPASGPLRSARLPALELRARGRLLDLLESAGADVAAARAALGALPADAEPAGHLWDPWLYERVVRTSSV